MQGFLFLCPLGLSLPRAPKRHPIHGGNPFPLAVVTGAPAVYPPIQPWPGGWTHARPPWPLGCQRSGRGRSVQPVEKRPKGSHPSPATPKPAVRGSEPRNPCAPAQTPLLFPFSEAPVASKLRGQVSGIIFTGGGPRAFLSLLWACLEGPTVPRSPLRGWACWTATGMGSHLPHAMPSRSLPGCSAPASRGPCC